jgi:hypothetical protein
MIQKERRSETTQTRVLELAAGYILYDQKNKDIREKTNTVYTF